MLDANSHQGQFGEDYVRVLASAVGLIVYTPNNDRDGVDLLLRRPGRVGAAAAPGIDVQVKSWSRARATEGSWRYDRLDEVQFNQLAGPRFTVPRYLFVVIVPHDAGHYSQARSDGLLLRHLGYYVSLRGLDPVPVPSRMRHRTVRVPIGNVLTAGSLCHLLGPDPSRVEDLGSTGGAL